MNRRLTAIGLLTWIVAGVPHLTGVLHGDLGVWWLIPYAAFGLLFYIGTRVTKNGKHPLSVIAAEAAVALLLAAMLSSGFMSILLVIVAAQVGGELPFRVAVVWIVVQSAILALIYLSTPGFSSAIVIALSYFMFQLFGVITTHAARSESRARQELAQANAELRVATELLGITSRTAERLRIARDLHDTVGHHLTALSLNLEVASHLAEGEARQHIEKSKTIAKDLLRDVRSVVSRMRLEEPVDLAAALRAIADAIPSPAVQLDLPDDLSTIDPGVAQVALRCVQEIVTNAVRHSCAKTLRLRIGKSGDPAQNGGALTIDASDDGVGSDRTLAGNGLRGMRERVEQVAGTVAVESAPGRGFTVRVTIPTGAAS
ncbi:MAG: putative signal transduction histidine kinase [Acidobacteria bacterium]|nr:putative signal transduction histidine kinase [Acidobacteriota bacterium]